MAWILNYKYKYKFPQPKEVMNPGIPEPIQGLKPQNSCFCLNGKIHRKCNLKISLCVEKQGGKGLCQNWIFLTYFALSTKQKYQFFKKFPPRKSGFI